MPPQACTSGWAVLFVRWLSCKGCTDGFGWNRLRSSCISGSLGCGCCLCHAICFRQYFQWFCGVLFSFHFSLKISGCSAYGCSPFTKPIGNARPCFHHVPCALWLVLFFEMGLYLGLTSSTHHWTICRPFAQFPVITREKIIHCSGQTHDTLPSVFIAVLGQQGFPVHLCCQ